MNNKRRSGRTTGLLIEAIGTAVKNPGKYISFFDHQPIRSLLMADGFNKVIKDYAERLELDISSNIVYVQANKAQTIGYYRIDIISTHSLNKNRCPNCGMTLK